MAIDIKAPLADRLFALGSTVGADNPTFKYKGGNRGSYHGSAPMPQPQQESDGRAKGLASVAGALVGAISNSSTPAATNAQGNGFGLGGNLASGEVGNANYAGTNNGLYSFMNEPQNAGQNGLFEGFKYGSTY